MFGDILQPTHLLFILFVALLVLGPKRLPEVGRSLGKGLRDFRSAMSGIETEFSEHTNLMSPPAPPAPPAAIAPPAPQVAEPATGTIPMVSPAAPQPLPESTPMPAEPGRYSADPISPDAVAARIGLASDPQPSNYPD